MVSPEALKGTMAPGFSLPAHTGQTFTFSPGQSGSRTVIFFFVAPGATRCVEKVRLMRDMFTERFEEKENVQLFGVNVASVARLRAFAESRRLQYPLLSDSNGQVIGQYGVGTRGLKLLSKRATFVIDENGIVRDVLTTALAWDTMKDVQHHVRFVAETLTSMDLEAAAAAESSTQ